MKFFNKLIFILIFIPAIVFANIETVKRSIYSSIVGYINSNNQASEDIQFLQHSLSQGYKNIEIELNEQHLFRLGSGDAGRFSGVTDKFKITINELNLDRIESSSYKDEFYLHEVLRALGFDDEHYELSILMMLAKNGLVLKDDLDDLFQKISLKQNYDYLYARDSGTSVGGGGDEIALELKAKYIISLMKRNFTNEQIYKALTTEIEPNTKSPNEFHVKTISRGGRTIILVPTIIYKYIPAQRQRIELELQKLVDSLL